MSIISNAVPNILSESLSKADTNRFGGAALEYSFKYESFARIGTPLTIRSGLVDLGEKTFTWQHWIFNAKSGILLAEAKALVITLDLKNRKSIAMPKKMFESLEAILIDNTSCTLRIQNYLSAKPTTTTTDEKVARRYIYVPLVHGRLLLVCGFD